MKLLLFILYEKLKRAATKNAAYRSFLGNMRVKIMFERLLREEAPRFPFGATIVVISAIKTEPIDAALLDLRTAGNPISLVMIGQAPEAELPAVPTYFVTQNWTEMERMEL